MPVLALGFDTSIDDEIRRNYNPNKIEKDMSLPALPKILNENNKQTATPKGTNASQASQISQIQKNQITNINAHLPQQYYAVLKKGTKIKVKSLNNIADNSKKGSRVGFVSIYPVSTTYLTIPTGTIFKGEIINSHRPQFSANGGLISINISSMILNEEIQPINAYITKADSKLIFRNNIKGKRKYFISMINSTKNGHHFFEKMIRVTSTLASDGSSILIAPFSLGAGVFTLGANVLLAPTLALFHKGDPIYIKAGSDFELKLSRDIYIYN